MSGYDAAQLGYVKLSSAHTEASRLSLVSLSRRKTATAATTGWGVMGDRDGKGKGRTLNWVVLHNLCAVAFMHQLSNCTCTLTHSHILLYNSIALPGLVYQ